MEPRENGLTREIIIADIEKQKKDLTKLDKDIVDLEAGTITPDDVLWATPKELRNVRKILVSKIEQMEAQLSVKNEENSEPEAPKSITLQRPPRPEKK